MGDFAFKLQQEDADEFSFLIEDGAGAVWRIPSMRTSDAVALFAAVEEGIGDYVHEMRQARAAYERAPKMTFEQVVDSFEGVGDFNSDDPLERYRAHQAAKGRA